MKKKKFDPKKLEVLNNPRRLEDIPPGLIVNLLGLKNVQTIVDVGAGTGFFTVKFAEILNVQKAYACDISPVMVKWIKDNLVPQHPYIIPVLSGEKSIPLKDKSVDLCFMIALHHELENPIAILKECKRILRKGGKIFVVDWKKKEMKEGPPINIRYTPDIVKNQMELVDFKNIFIFEELPKFFLVGGEN